jgi:hypothetical protein
MSARQRARSTTKIRLKNNLYSHGHFTEHLVSAFRKPPRECNLKCKTSSFLIRQLKNKTGLHLQQSIQESENSKTVNGGGKCSQLSGFSTVLESESSGQVRALLGVGAARHAEPRAGQRLKSKQVRVDHPWSSIPGLLLMSRSSLLHVTSHLSPAHHKTSKHDSPSDTKRKRK